MPRELMLGELVGAICLVWYLVVVVVCITGYVQIRRYYSSVPQEAPIVLEDDDAPHITIIRPVKGLEPSLYDCLAATFRQTYPKGKVTIYLCIASRDDPALPILRRLLDDFPECDASIFVEEEDPALQGHDGPQKLGPNPKIRNMTRAYREAKSDIVWILDCNVWIARGVAARMVSTLAGHSAIKQRQKKKFAHQLPVVVDVTGRDCSSAAQGVFQTSNEREELHAASARTASCSTHYRTDGISWMQRILDLSGGRLEEMFMSSSHAKFYTAINTVLLAPCIIGKSTMFRRSHLDHLTSSFPGTSPGIDFFSNNICEDHLIGDLLWKGKVQEEQAGETWGKHAMVFGDLAIQPISGMSVKDYISRRVRWLRVRKFTVTLATLVEPGTESFVCSLCGAFAVTSLPWFHRTVNIPPTWTAFALLWLTSAVLWAVLDWTLYQKLHSAASIEVDDYTPEFAKRPRSGRRRRPAEWLAAWLAREILAFPVWIWAVFGGVTVVWRGKRLWISMDMRVHEFQEDPVTGTIANWVETQESRKARKD